MANSPLTFYGKVALVTGAGNGKSLVVIQKPFKNVCNFNGLIYIYSFFFLSFKSLR